MSKIEIIVHGDNGSEPGEVTPEKLSLLRKLGATVEGSTISLGLAKTAKLLGIPVKVLRQELGLKGVAAKAVGLVKREDKAPKGKSVRELTPPAKAVKGSEARARLNEYLDGK